MNELNYEVENETNNKTGRGIGKESFSRSKEIETNSRSSVWRDNYKMACSHSFRMHWVTSPHQDYCGFKKGEKWIKGGG